MFSPSTAPRWKIAIKVLRRPPVMGSRAWASKARWRNDGAESETPMLASAMLPDLMKNLLFMLVPQFRVSGFEFRVSSSVACELETRNSKLETFLLPLKLRRTQNQSDDLRHRIRDARFHARQLTSATTLPPFRTSAPFRQALL